ncbi:hypothetical protein [Cypionkella psychrotolerans]|uniref:hypothetical protein n=1 Tax=Cypionkella psychrotolerans TaxID=1678131 RepID=UPI0006B3FEB6|nr:hypothetical protein [Cypionkella psychrotolerans]
MPESREQLDAMISPRFGTLPGMREGAFIESCNKPGAVVEIEALIPAYLAGTMWCGAWRFYVVDPERDVRFVLQTTRADRPKTVKTIIGAMNLISHLGPHKLSLPTGPW